MGSCIGRKTSASVIVASGPSDYSQHNSFLDRWTEPQVKILGDKFNRHKTPNGMNRKAFLDVFPKLSEFPVQVAVRCFRFFDQRLTGTINFREFCIGLAKILLVSRKEKAAFIFYLFDLDGDDLLNQSETELFFKCSSSTLRQLAATPKENILAHKGKLPETAVDKESFLAWAIRNLELDQYIEMFELVPGPNKEREKIKKHQEGVDRPQAGEVLYLLSSAWWEVWKAYVNYEEELDDLEESNNEFHLIQPANRCKTVPLGDKPVEIDNSPLLAKDSKLKLNPSARFKRDFVVLKSKAWNKLLEWYGGGPAFPRSVILENGRPLMELFPPVMEVVELSPIGALLTLESRPFMFSKKELISNALKEVCKVFGKTLEKSRLLKKKGSELVPLKASDKIEDCFSGETIVVETSFTERGEVTWPSERNRYYEFKEGDKVKSKGDTEGVVISIRGEKVRIRTSEGIEFWDKSSCSLSTPIAVPAKESPGTVGLYNLGNTCYVNCIVQALSNTPLLKNFFTSEVPKGKFSQEFSSLLKTLWNSKESRFSPVRFLKHLVKTYPIFEGNEQHDCHEFLSLLLDAMHEELKRQEEGSGNRPVVLENPKSKQEETKHADDQWRELQGSQGSIVTDLFGGQTRTTLTCTSCSNKRVLFEIFTSLSLPVPCKMEIPLYVVIIPLHTSVFRIGIVVSTFATVKDIVVKTSQVTGISPQKLILGEFFMKRHLTNLENHLSESIQKLGINTNSELFAFEIIRDVEEAELLGKKVLAYQNKTAISEGDYVDVFNSQGQWVSGKVVQEIKLGRFYEYLIDFDETETEMRRISQQRVAPFRTYTQPKNPSVGHITVLHLSNSTGQRQCLGFPSVISIGNWFNMGDLYNLAYRFARRFLSERYSSLRGPPFQILLLDPTTLQCGSCRACSGCILSKNKTSVKPILESYKKVVIGIEWEQGCFSEEIKNHHSVAETKAQEETLNKPVDITETLNSFTEEELLDSKCEKCQSKVKMQMHIWRVPDILILIFKRFAFHEGSIHKIDQEVNFPVYAFDISEWVKGVERANGLTLSTTSLQSAFDLYAVVNHSGSLTAGHYTTMALSQDQVWLNFDDEQVLQFRDDPESFLKTKNAYLLFYKRRKFSSSNVINLTYNIV
mmetsp:Transcript_7983/g.11781  ORF Transcript_7983/g.11781 Transcript_7983/m.11781 type:complete len:1135 (+) Transcript_7983:1577-4981(+)